jgi:hypothetical protein
MYLGHALSILLMRKCWMWRGRAALRRQHDPNAIANELAQDLHWNMALNRDLAGYGINPHTDAARKHVTVLYYLPGLNSTVPRDAGTCLLKSTSRPPRVQRHGSFRRNPDAFRCDKHARSLGTRVTTCRS